MNIEMLEELIRRKVRTLQKSGLARAEAVAVAENDIMRSVEPGFGCASRFCIHMILEGVKKRILGESAVLENSEGDKTGYFKFCCLKIVDSCS